MNRELTYHDLKEERELVENLSKEDKVYLVKEIIEKNRRLDELEREVNELRDFEKWYYILEDRIRKAIEYIKEKYYEDLYDETLTQFQDNLLEILKGAEENE